MSTKQNETATTTGVAQFTLNIQNTSTSALTLSGLTNGAASPPCSSGNPPVVMTLVGSGNVTNVIQTSGGETTDNRMPATNGNVSYNLQDGGQLKVTWSVPPGSEGVVTAYVSDSTLFGTSAPVFSPAGWVIKIFNLS